MSLSVLIVPVKNLNGDVQICADYKCTVNKALQKHPYQILALNLLLVNSSGRKVFANVDLAQAY